MVNIKQSQLFEIQLQYVLHGLAQVNQIAKYTVTNDSLYTATCVYTCKSFIIGYEW